MIVLEKIIKFKVVTHDSDDSEFTDDMGNVVDVEEWVRETFNDKPSDYVNFHLEKVEKSCYDCQYYVSDSSSSSCLRRDDVGYKGTCIDGLEYQLGANCSYR